MCGHREKALRMQGEVPPGSDPAGARTSDLQTPDCEKIALLFKGTQSVV